MTSLAPVSDIPVSVIDGRTRKPVEDVEVRAVPLGIGCIGPPWGSEGPVLWARAYGEVVPIADGRLVLPDFPRATSDHVKTLLVAIAGDRVDYHVQGYGYQIDSLRFEVYPRRSLRGRVVDPDGKPVVGMPLLVSFGGHDFGTHLPFGSTGDNGTFRLGELDWCLATMTPDGGLTEFRSGIRADSAYSPLLTPHKMPIFWLDRTSVPGPAPEVELQVPHTGIVHVTLAGFEQAPRIERVSLDVRSKSSDRWREFSRPLDHDGWVRFWVQVGVEFRVRWKSPRAPRSGWEGDLTDVRNGPSKAGDLVDVSFSREL